MTTLLFKQGEQLIIDSRFQKQIKIFIKLTYSTAQMEELKMLTFSQNIIDQHRGIIGLRKIISVQQPPIDQFFEAGVIPKIVQMAKLTQYPQLQLQAIWILTNIASGTQQHVQLLSLHNVIQLFIEILQYSDNKFIIDETIWGLANMVADSKEYRDKIMNLGLETINSILKDQQKSKHILKNGIWLLSNICRLHPNPPYQRVRQSLQIMIDFLDKQSCSIDYNNIQDILWPLTFYAHCQQIHNALTNRENVIRNIIGCLKTQLIVVLVPAIRILKQLIFNLPSVLQLMVSYQEQFIPSIKQLLSHHKSAIRKCVFSLIGNVFLGSEDNIALLLGKQIINKLEEAVFQGTAREQQQALIVFINLVRRNYPSQQVYNFLTIFISKNTIAQLNGSTQIRKVSQFYYYALLFCLKFKENFPGLKEFFIFWKQNWAQFKHKIVVNQDEIVIQLMLRTQTIINAASNQMECE